MINIRRNILIMEMQVEMQGCSRCKKNLSINEFPIKKNGKGHKKTCRKTHSLSLENEASTFEMKEKLLFFGNLVLQDGIVL